MKIFFYLTFFLLLLSLVNAQESGGGQIGSGATFSRTNVLTPGEVDDWPISEAKGETIIVSIASNHFDTALEILSPKDELVAQNDDIEKGEKNSRLLFTLTMEGTYKIRVKSFKSNAGGRYSFHLIRFKSNATKIGERLSGLLKKELLQWYAFEVKKNQVVVATTRSAAFQPSLKIYSPQGEKIQSEFPQNHISGTTQEIFRATEKGTYFARVSSRHSAASHDSFTFTTALARVFSTTIQEKNKEQQLPANSLDLWKFKGNAGDVIQLKALAPQGEMKIQLSFLPPLDNTTKELPENPLVLLPADPKSKGQIVALLNETGEYQVFVTQSLGLSLKYQLVTDYPAKPFLPETATSPHKLSLGNSDYYSLTGKSNQIFCFEAHSIQFDTYLELYDPKGESIAANDDGSFNRNSLLTSLLRESGRYLLRVSAYGSGGSGEYHLKKIENLTRPINLSSRIESTLGLGASDIFSFQAKAGQIIILSVRSSEIDPQVKIVGPDAVEVARDDNGGEGINSLLSIRLSLDGYYTVWVSAKSGNGKYVLRLFDAQ